MDKETQDTILKIVEAYIKNGDQVVIISERELNTNYKLRKGA